MIRAPALNLIYFLIDHYVSHDKIIFMISKM